MVQIPLTAEEFHATAERLRAQHKIAIAGEQGTIEKFGVKADYLYSHGNLSVTILDKPFFFVGGAVRAPVTELAGGEIAAGYDRRSVDVGRLCAGPSTLVAS